MGNRSYSGPVLGDVVGAAAWGSKTPGEIPCLGISPGVVLGDLVDVADCGSKIVLCISEQIYTLRVVEWLRADVYAACSVCVGGLS